VTNLNRALRLARNTKNPVLHDGILRSICRFLISQKNGLNKNAKKIESSYRDKDLLPFIHRNLQIGMWVDLILDAAEMIVDPEVKTTMLTELCETLSKDQLFNWVFDVAKRMPPSRDRCNAFFSLTEGLIQKGELSWAAQVVRHIKNPYLQDWASVALQQHSAQSKA
jgi:hypothetical protein